MHPCVLMTRPDMRRLCARGDKEGPPDTIELSIILPLSETSYLLCAYSPSWPRVSRTTLGLHFVARICCQTLNACKWCALMVQQYR